MTDPKVAAGLRRLGGLSHMLRGPKFHTAEAFNAHLAQFENALHGMLIGDDESENEEKPKTRRRRGTSNRQEPESTGSDRAED